MIKSFRDKGLSELWTKGRSKAIDAKLHKRILRRLDRLDAATGPEELNVPGFNFHALKGFHPTRYTVHVNGPWCVTFEFEDGDAVRVDLEQYH
ncbi:MAG: type II toxin-antitoxin system RelE/ParE family toxin [Geminicoccaceae bacterium]